ncbi:MAG: transglycosylase domain-containing protein [Candidatus Pacebacteria bacterium]|nr:transglycosylase domain-containing protein [Candidatus Paceibacterota bacterium]MDD4074338.1 transglycosylase domain-containing protein [Candidatus Paceibacterota bacterium]
MKKRKRSLFKLLGIALLFVFLTGILVFFYFVRDLPRPEVFTEAQLNLSTKIYDRDGKVILSNIYGEEKRTYVKLPDISENIVHAVIATEDADFYNHIGIDFNGILRAIKLGITNFSLDVPGGSTLTQQLIRSTFLTTEKKIERKVKEIVLSLELDRKYSKDQILEWYLNQVPFGVNIYGIEEASQTYFQKSAKDLSIEESAVLASMIQAPSYYSPYGRNIEDLLKRKDYVLERMAITGYISEEERDELKEIEITFSSRPKTLAVHFVNYVKKQIEELYGPTFLETKGLKIYTTLNWDLQQEAEETIKESVANNIIRFGAYNSSLIAIDHQTGEILSMVGSADPWGESFPEGCDPATNCKFVPDFNVATLGERQPGSSFKPIVYAEAFVKGYTDQTIVVDEYTSFGIWGGKEYAPQNYDGRFRGPVTLRNALAQSLNIPAVKVLNDFAGLNDSIALAKKMGITTLTQPASFYGLSLVLGGGDVRLIDMVSVYSVFANGGYRIEPSSILKIEDANGNIIYENKNTPRKVLEKNVCEMITDILSDNDARAPIFGYYSNLRFDNYKVFVKTGTTQNNVDGWTIGCTDKTCVGVWSGNNDNTSMVGGVGESASGPAWRKIIEKSVELVN